VAEYTHATTIESAKASESEASAVSQPILCSTGD